MKFVIQRVNYASVTVDGQTVGAIEKGLLVLIGISHTDTQAVADRLVHKLLSLRIFEDENGKTNLSLKDVSGGLLLVSQFTLYADCRRGNRPSFVKAGAPEQAKELYESIIAMCREECAAVEQGVFGAHMKLLLENDGPFTVVLDSEELM